MKGLLFDWDGTLLDSNALILKVWQQVGKTIGRTFEKEKFEGLIGLVPKDMAIALFPGEDASGIDQIIDLRLRYYDHFYKEAIPFPETKELLDYLSRHAYKMAIITSNTSDKINRKLRAFGWLSYFDCVIGADVIPDGKPSARIVLEGARRLGLRPDACYVIGDSQYDIEAGRDAGAATIVVCRERNRQKHLQRFKPDYLVDHLLEVSRILEGLWKGDAEINEAV